MLGLKKRKRNPGERVRYKVGAYDVDTFREALELAKMMAMQTGRVVSVMEKLDRMTSWHVVKVVEPMETIKKNPVVISHKKALALTKKIIAYAKRLMKHERAGVRENPGVEYHKQKFVFYMKELEKYRIASKRYIEVLAKAYEHLQSMEDSK